MAAGVVAAEGSGKWLAAAAGMAAGVVAAEGSGKWLWTLWVAAELANGSSAVGALHLRAVGEQVDVGRVPIRDLARAVRGHRHVDEQHQRQVLDGRRQLELMRRRGQRRLDRERQAGWRAFDELTARGASERGEAREAAQSVVQRAHVPVPWRLCQPRTDALHQPHN